MDASWGFAPESQEGGEATTAAPRACGGPPSPAPRETPQDTPRDTKEFPKQLLATVRCLFGAPLAAHSGVPKSLLGLPLGAPLGDPAGHRDHSPAPPGRPATPGPRPKPRKTRRSRATDPNRRLRFNLASPPRAYQRKWPKEIEESVRDPTEHPKGPQRDPQNNESRRCGGPFWAPLAAHKRTQKGPPGHPWGTEGAAKTAPNET